MKAAAFALAALVAAAPLAMAETPDGVSEALVALEKRSWEAWKNRDGKFFQDFLSDDHVEVGFGGPADKAAVVAVVGSPVCVVSSYAIDKFKVTQFDASTALVVYRAEQDTKCGAMTVPSPVWVSSLYVKRDGRWVNALYQQTQAPKPAAKEPGKS